MKRTRIWILAGLLALLCVGTGLALSLSNGGIPLLLPAETGEPEQTAAQPEETAAEAVPGQSTGSETLPQPEQTDENTGTPDAEATEPAESAEPAPKESAVAGSEESPTPAPNESAGPAAGTHGTPAPGQSPGPTPRLSAAPVPSASAAPTQAQPHPSDTPDTPAPSGTVTPTAAVTNSPALPSQKVETAPPASPLPTLPVSLDAKTQDEIRINELYASINALRDEATAQLAALADQAEAEWLSIRDQHPSRKRFVLKYFDQATELEEAYDAQVDALCNELQYLLTKTGGDTSIVWEIRSEYESEKESTRAAYYRRFMALLEA